MRDDSPLALNSSASECPIPPGVHLSHFQPLCPSKVLGLRTYPVINTLLVVDMAIELRGRLEGRMGLKNACDYWLVLETTMRNCSELLQRT
jgi:hypothetical protein